MIIMTHWGVNKVRQDTIFNLVPKCQFRVKLPLCRFEELLLLSPSPPWSNLLSLTLMMYKSANWSRLLTIINFLCIDRWQIDHLKVLRGSFPKTLDCLRWKRYNFTRLFIGKFSANAKKLSVLRGKSLKQGIKFKFMDLSYFSPWFSNKCLKKPELYDGETVEVIKDVTAPRC